MSVSMERLEFEELVENATRELRDKFGDIAAFALVCVPLNDNVEGASATSNQSPKWMQSALTWAAGKDWINQEDTYEGP